MVIRYVLETWSQSVHFLREAYSNLEFPLEETDGKHMIDTLSEGVSDKYNLVRKIQIYTELYLIELKLLDLCKKKGNTIRVEV